MPTRSDQARVELLQGTLDLLILRTLRKQLEIETSKWDTLATAVGRTLRPAAEEE